jgi:formamidopyrimidine-DNA glycosylase
VESIAIRKWKLVSIELPETRILAEQMTGTLIDKNVKSVELSNYEKLQKVGFINKKIKDFDKLIDCKIISIAHRGNVIRFQFNKKVNLVLCGDYGAQYRYFSKGEDLPTKVHFKMGFTDGTFFTIRQTGMGLIYVAEDSDVPNLYVYKRDFSDTPSPIGEHGFTNEKLSMLLDEKKQNIKAALVGKTAVVVGLSNAAFQEIIYKAGIHPKRNTGTLTETDKNNIYDSIKEVLNERICSGGKEGFEDLFGKPGRHIPSMGPNMKDKNCPQCGAAIEKISHGGGQVYLCPRCQI